MGSRANLAIIENHTLELYYSHWAGETLPHDLFWGLPHALAFIRAQHRLANDNWLDDVWCEGGCVLNLDKSYLIFFCREDFAFDIPLRRVFLSLFRHTWPAWHIEWANQGIVDLAFAVGIPREKVLAERTPRNLVSQGDYFEAAHGPDCDAVVTVCACSGNLSVLRVYRSQLSILEYGPTLLPEILAKATSNPAQKIIVQGPSDTFPTFGFHVDISAHRLDFWAAEASLAVVSAITSAWKGWAVNYLKDDYERHQELTNERILFAPPSRRVLLTRMAGILSLPMFNPAKSAMESAAILANKGHTVEVNPAITMHIPSIVSPEFRNAILIKIWEAEDHA